MRIDKKHMMRTNLGLSKDMLRYEFLGEKEECRDEDWWRNLSMCCSRVVGLMNSLENFQRGVKQG